jgi:hypothetical protein
MAFTETEKATLTEILGITYSALDTHLDYVVLTTEVEDAIQADIVLWATYRNAISVSIEPKDSNFGARVDSGDIRRSIIARIANWLELDLISSTGSEWARTERA